MGKIRGVRMYFSYAIEMTINELCCFGIELSICSLKSTPGKIRTLIAKPITTITSSSIATTTSTTTIQIRRIKWAKEYL